MKTTIQSLHFTSRQELNDFVNEKVEKLNHLHTGILAADVCLKVDKSDTKANKVAEIRLSIPGKDLFAKKQCSTFEEAVTETVNALQQQLHEVKSRLESEKHERGK